MTRSVENYRQYNSDSGLAANTVKFDHFDFPTHSSSSSGDPRMRVTSGTLEKGNTIDTLGIHSLELR